MGGAHVVGLHKDLTMFVRGVGLVFLIGGGACVSRRCRVETRRGWVATSKMANECRRRWQRTTVGLLQGEGKAFG
jgi:hypothetical protein